jgi:hypothetical protein
MLTPMIGGSEHSVPTHANVMMFGLSAGPHVIKLAGSG